MNDWKVNLADPEVWIRRLKVSEEIRKQRADDLQWKRAQDAYQGKLLASPPTSDTVVVNFPYAYISNLLPSIYFAQPRIQVRPTQEAFHQASKMMEPLLNYEIRRMRFARQARRAILDMLIVGHGWTKLGWASKYGEVPGPEQGTAATEPMSPGKQPYTRHVHFRPGSPFFFRVDPRMMLVDPNANTPEEMRWVAQMYYKAYSYLMEDPFIQNKEKISPGFRMTPLGMPEPITAKYEHELNKGEELCLCYEIWDLDSRKVRVIADGSKDWQRDEPWPYEFFEGLPYYYLAAGDGLDDIYPQSPLVTWLDQNEELSKIRTMQLDSLYRARGKIIVGIGALDDEELEKLKDPLCDVVIAKAPDKITAFKTMNIDPNGYICEDRVKKDIMDISGLSELQYGSIPGGRVTATVGLIAQKAGAIRARRLVDAIRDWIIDTAGDLSKLLAHRMPEPQSIAITTDTGTDWMEIHRSDVQGEFLFDMDVTEMAPLSREARQKEAIDLLAATQQSPEARRRRFLVDLLEAFGRNEIDAYLYPEMGPPQDPQYENEQMIQGVEVLPNPQEDFGLHLQVHADFMETPLFQTVTSQVPAIKNLFSAHVQRTMALAQQSGALDLRTSGSAGAPASPLGPGAVQLEQGRPLGAAQRPVAPAILQGE